MEYFGFFNIYISRIIFFFCVLIFFPSFFKSASAQSAQYAVVANKIESPYLNGLGVTDMVMDSSGVFWITTRNRGIYRYDGEVVSLIEGSFNNEFNPFYTSIASISPGEWIVGSRGVYIYEGGSWLKDKTFPDTLNTCVDVLNTGMGKIYALTSSKLYYRGIFSHNWQEEDIPGLNGAFQIIQKRGVIAISSKSGLWMRNVSGLWTQIIDIPISTSMPLGDQWLAVSDSGLLLLEESGWIILEKKIKGYHTFSRTKDESGVWVYGESGLWFIRSDGRCTQLYTHGGLFLETLTSGCLTGSGGLLLAAKNSLLRVDDPSVWYDLRTLPYNVGTINSIASISTDSSWIKTSTGLFSVGPKSSRRIDAPAEGLTMGVMSLPQFGIISFGEFGAYEWRKDKWSSIYNKGWVYSAKAIDRMIILSIPNGDILGKRDEEDLEKWIFKSKIDSSNKFIKESYFFDNGMVGFSSYGLFVQSDQRKLPKTLTPGLIIRDVNREAYAKGIPIFIRIGLRGTEDIIGEIPLEYKVDDGVWLSIGVGRRIVLERLNAGSHSLDIRAQLVEQRFIAPISFDLNVELPSWRRPEYFIISLSSLLFIFLILGSLIWKRAQEKKKWLKEKFRLERMALRLQMNPHFTFNALESISAFILQSEPKEAVMYLQKFSSLMRYTLESAEKPYVNIQKEKKALENYISLEQMRFNNGFQSVVQFDDSIIEDELLIPPMLIQPLVENSILHGLRPLLKEKRDDGVLRLVFMMHPQLPDTLLIQIEDNGVGREVSRINNSGDEGAKRSAATKILSKRLKAMQLESGFNHQVIIEDLDAGTRVSLVLPIIRDWEFSK